MTYQQTMQGGGMQQPGMQQAGMQPGMQQGMQPGMQQGMQQGLQQVGMQQSGMQQGMQQAGMQQPGMPMVSMGMQQQRPQATSVGGISQASPMAFGQQVRKMNIKLHVTVLDIGEIENKSKKLSFSDFFSLMIICFV